MGLAMELGFIGGLSIFLAGITHAMGYELAATVSGYFGLTLMSCALVAVVTFYFFGGQE